ncbi:UPF0147 family protein [Candidatus Micrarchaeota archaeon]|nr:UPF0147 family protein [Candidatus Micrarchaeota archaeon]
MGSQFKEQIRRIVDSFDMLADDPAVPKNVRNRMQEAKQKLQSDEDISTSISSAVYALDEVSNDINLPMHARTLVWNLLSELEALKSQAQG